MKILSVDIGTTAMKMGVFEDRDNDLSLINQFYREYPINTYNDGLYSDIEPQKWQQAFAAGCKEMSDYMPEIDVIASPPWTGKATHFIRPSLCSISARVPRPNGLLIQSAWKNF